MMFKEILPEGTSILLLYITREIVFSNVLCVGGPEAWSCFLYNADFVWLKCHPITEVPVHMVDIPVHKENGVSGIESRPRVFEFCLISICFIHEVPTKWLVFYC